MDEEAAAGFIKWFCDEAAQEKIAMLEARIASALAYLNHPGHYCSACDSLAAKVTGLLEGDPNVTRVHGGKKP